MSRNPVGIPPGQSRAASGLTLGIRRWVAALAIIGLCAAAPLLAATTNLTSLLQQGLFEEEANRNLDAAIASYQSLATQFDKDRQVAATAVFRLGECYRKLGRTNEAVVQYQRVVKEFSDQATLVTLSRQNLAGLNAAPEASASAPASLAAREEQKKLLKQQIQLAEQDLADAQSRFSVGGAQQADVRAAEMSVLRLREKLAAVEANQPELLSLMPETTPVTDEEEKEIRRIQAMIRNSPDLINASDKDGWTPLQRAAVAGQLRVAQYLLDTHANLEAKNRENNTALILAAGAGHKAMVELLLNRGASVNARGTRDNRTALHHAAYYGFNAVAETLLAHKADVNAPDSEGQTPLHTAAGRGYREFVQSLLANRADVNVKSRGGYTPLHSAASGGQIVILQLILAAKANVNARNENGETPFLLAVKFGKRDAAEALLAAGTDPRLAGTEDSSRNVSSLHYAVANGDEVLTRELLERGADPNLSAARRPVSVVRPGEFSWGGAGPALFTACENNKPALVSILLEHGANPNVRHDNSEQTPLLVNMWSRPEILKLLLEHKADPNLATTSGQTALHEVSRSGPGLTNVIALLVEHAANINAQTQDDYTPLHVAVANNRRENVEALLAFRADPNLRNERGETPLDLAKRSGQSLPRPPGIPSPGMPPGTRTIPARTARPGTPSSDSGSEVSMASLLLQHGAMDNLPRLNRIELARPSANFSDAVIWKGKNDWNRFSLLEVIAKHYSFINVQPAGESSLMTGNRNTIWKGSGLDFPDFAAVVIHRPSADGKSWKNIPVDVAAILGSGDCSRDVWLQWGDVVEIPEADHPVSERWAGFAEPERRALIKCVSRTITISINNTNVAFQLAPVFVSPPGMTTMDFYGRVLSPGDAGRRSVSCMIRSVLDQSKLIRFSSDLSRVKVNRRDPTSGKTESWLMDCSDGNNLPDLWLRDGDVVTVPEK